MTNRAINKAIAEFLGWKELDFHLDGKHILGNRPTFSNGKIISYTVDQYVPDYCNDLNAIQEVVNTLKDPIQQSYYVYYLGDWSTFEKGEYATFGIVNSTAKERAKAFLKTIGKWEQ